MDKVGQWSCGYLFREAEVYEAAATQVTIHGSIWGGKTHNCTVPKQTCVETEKKI
jgi:hypothetical protein